jgi:uncharacterized protein (TIGR02246 family)
MLSGSLSLNAGQGAAAEAAVEAVITAWADAFATMDGAKSAALYSADGRLWGTSGVTQAIGPDPIRAYFDSGRQRAKSRQVVIGEHGTRVYGDTAVSSGSYTFQSVLLDGSPSVRRARFSMTFVRQNGRWRIVDHHSSDVPASP